MRVDAAGDWGTVSRGMLMHQGPSICSFAFAASWAALPGAQNGRNLRKLNFSVWVVQSATFFLVSL